MTTRTEWTKNNCYRTRRFTTIPTELASLYIHGVTNLSTSDIITIIFSLTGTKYTHTYFQHKKPSWGNTSAPAHLLLLKQKETWVCFSLRLTHCSTIPSLFRHQ